MNDLLVQILKGIVLGVLYFEVTKANDTTMENIFSFVCFYVVMVNCAYLAGIDPNIVTNAFVTKAVFTLVDERVKRKTPKDPLIN